MLGRESFLALLDMYGVTLNEHKNADAMLANTKPSTMGQGQIQYYKGQSMPLRSKIIHPHTHAPPLLVLNPAPHQTLLRPQRKGRRDCCLERREVIPINLRWEAERGVEDRGIDAEEVLRDRAHARILIAQARDEDGRIAVVVELEVNASLGEDCSLELGEGGVLLDSEAVLEDKAGLNV